MANFFKKFKTKLGAVQIYNNYKIWFLIPLCIVFVMLICGTIYSFVPNIDGFANIGIDFQGGTVLTVEMNGDESMLGSDELYNKHKGWIEEVLNSNGIKVGVVQQSGTSAIMIRYKNNVDGYNLNNNTAKMDEANRKVCEQIDAKFTEMYPNSKIEMSSLTSMTGASASSKLLKTGFLSVGIAILLMLVYIMIRFDFFSGLSAILALVHDVIIMLALSIIFRVQMNSSIVAAVITIVAYSINNTIIIFDRIREMIAPFKAKNQKIDVALVVDSAVKQTLTRSIYTTLTTMVTILALAILGVPTIREFALPILFGLVSGFYSSICIAPSIWGLLMIKKNNSGNSKPKAIETPTNKKKKKGDNVKPKDKAIAYK